MNLPCVLLSICWLEREREREKEREREIEREKERDTADGRVEELFYSFSYCLTYDLTL